MNKNLFIENFRNAFGNYELPIAFWYSPQPVATPEKTKGCFIKYLKPAREGALVSFNLETISCPGGKVYCGFTEMPPTLPPFVAEKEKYKASKELVADFVTDLKIPDKSELFINFSSIDKIESFDTIEGLIFFANPDVLTGLVSWALYDRNEADTVSVPFGSGCSSIVSQTVVENRNNGNRVFLGLFDPSARPHVEPDILSLAVPMSRFRKMYHTFNASCLGGSRAWSKVKERIENNGA